MFFNNYHTSRELFFSFIKKSINFTGEIPVIDLKTVAKLLWEENPELSAK
jgi:hypothetical protein